MAVGPGRTTVVHRALPNDPQPYYFQFSSHICSFQIGFPIYSSPILVFLFNFSVISIIYIILFILILIICMYIYLILNLLMCGSVHFNCSIICWGEYNLYIHSSAFLAQMFFINLYISDKIGKLYAYRD